MIQFLSSLLFYPPSAGADTGGLQPQLAVW
jgi:hypothetical protein